MRWWEWRHEIVGPGDHPLDWPGATAPRPMFELENARPIGFHTKWGPPPAEPDTVPDYAAVLDWMEEGGTK